MLSIKYASRRSRIKPYHFLFVHNLPISIQHKLAYRLEHRLCAFKEIGLVVKSHIGRLSVNAQTSVDIITQLSDRKDKWRKSSILLTPAGHVTHDVDHRCLLCSRSIILDAVDADDDDGGGLTSTMAMSSRESVLPSTVSMMSSQYGLVGFRDGLVRDVVRQSQRCRLPINRFPDKLDTGELLSDCWDSSAEHINKKFMTYHIICDIMGGIHSSFGSVLTAYFSLNYSRLSLRCEFESRVGR